MFRICRFEIVKPFDARWIAHLAHELTRMTQAFGASDQTLLKRDDTAVLVPLINDLEASGLPLSAQLVRRLIETTEHAVYAPKISDLREWNFELVRRIEDEMRGQTFLRLEADEPLYFDGKALDWGAARDLFPIGDEVDEAAKCFALCRYPATVFHMMRVLEAGLNGLAGELSVPFEHANWENIINNIEARLQSMEKAPNSPPDPHRKARLHFYGEAARHFRFLKEAWRNYAMHTKETYDKGTAFSVLHHTTEFMRQLAVKRPWLP